MPESSEKSQRREGFAKPVGYGNPPEATRFKKGQSGNPKGRRKGSINVATALARTLLERVVVVENGRRKKITKIEAALKQALNKAATGDLRALQLLVNLSRGAETREGLSQPSSPALGESDQKVMERFVKRIQTVTEAERGQK